LSQKASYCFCRAAISNGTSGLAGLRAEALYGDWDRQPFHQRTSEEMIFVVRRTS
jgi:hypothetical protein